MAYIKGGKEGKLHNALELMQKSLEHETAKHSFYPKWALNNEVFRAARLDDIAALGLPLYQTLPTRMSRLLKEDTFQVINHIVPAVKYLAGVMTAATFTKLVPEVYTHQTIQQTKIWEDALWYFYRQSGLSNAIYLANILRFVFGDGFIILTWNPKFSPDCACYDKWQKGRLAARMDENVEAEVLEYYGEEYDPKMHCQCTGGLQATVKSPIDIIINKEALCDNDVEWCIEREKMELEHAKEIFDGPKERGFLGEAHKLGIMESSSVNSHEALFSEGASPMHKFYQAGTATETVIEKRWQRANDKYPRGRLTITGMDGTVGLYDGPLPYNHVNKLPLFRFGYESVPGSYWSETNISRAAPIQLDANDFLNKFRDIIKNHAAIKLMLDRRSGCTEDWNNDATDMVEYNGDQLNGAPPAWYLNTGNPSQVWNNTIAWYEQSLKTVLNFFEMQQGNIPKEITSGKMLNRAMEESSRQIRPVAERDVITYDNLYSFMLSLISENMPDSFFERFTGRNRGKYMYAVGTSFRDIQYKVHTEVRSVFDMSVFTKTEDLKQNIGLGIVRSDEIEDVRKILAGVGGGLEDLDELNRPGEMNAFDENERLLAEGIINDLENSPYPYENHRAHYRIHSKFVETPEFRELPPQIQQIMYKHLDLTKGAIQEEVMEAAQMNQMMHGGIGTQPAGNQGGEGQFAEAGAPE